MSALLSWLKPYEWIVWIVCLVLIVGSVWGYGHYEYRQGVNSVQLADTKAVLQVTLASSDATQRVITQYVPKVQYIQTQGQTITHEVVKYVTTKDDSRCTVNAGFVRMWNAANQMQFPAAASSTDGQASNVVLSDIAAQHATEATLTHLDEAQIQALQDWILAQQQAYQGKGPN
jgi:hypothetical protein